MKRIVCVIMAGLMMIAGTNAVAFAQEQKYEELIRYLDEGDYEAAHQYIDHLQEESAPQESETDSTDSDLSQTPSGEDILEIELTPENFKDYFDIVFSDTETHMDAFNEEASNYSNTFLFVNNAFDDGLLFLGTSDDFAVEINIQILEGSREDSLEIDFDRNALETSGWGFSHSDSADVSITDFSMSRVKGTVFFAKKEDVDSFKRVEDYHSAEGYDVYQAGNSVNGEVWKVINVIKQVTP